MSKGQSRNCPFCEAGVGPTDTVWYNQPLLSTPNFVVLPSIGALVPGWVLVAPKKHFLSVASIPYRFRQELGGLLKRATGIVEQGFGATVQFEHGPATHNSQIGCGLDHAHIHVVPIGFDLVDTARSDPTIAWSKLGSGFHEIQTQGNDYLAITNQVSSWIGHPIAPVSQYFRKLVALKLGIPDQFDYNKFSHIENVRITAQTLLKLSGIEGQAHAHAA